MTIPDTQMRLTLAQGGDLWDAVRVEQVIGEALMVRLGAACGSVVSDGARMWFFVKPGEGHALEAPAGATVIGRGGYVLIPADRITQLPGPHWSRVGYRRHTNTHRMRAALKAVLS